MWLNLYSTQWTELTDYRGSFAATTQLHSRFPSIWSAELALLQDALGAEAIMSIAAQQVWQYNSIRVLGESVL